MDTPRRLWEGDASNEALRLRLLAAVAILLGLGALHVAASMTVLLVFALFAAMVVAPLARWTPGGRRWPGIVAAGGAMLAVIALFAGGLVFAALRAGGELRGASAGARLGDGRPAPAEGAEGSSGGVLSVLDVSARDLAERAAGTLGDAALGIAATAGAALGGVALVFFLTLLVLMDLPGWRRRLGALGLSEERRQALVGAFAATAWHVRRYLLVRLGVGLLTAALYVGWLWIFGIDLLTTWAVLTVILGFVPNIGSVLSGLLPTLYVLLTRDPGSALLVAGGLLVIEQVMGNLVDPRLQGRNVRVAPSVILVSILFWGWVWGVAGTLVAVPTTILLICLMARVEPLRPAAYMLTACEDWDEFDRTTAPPEG